MLNISIAAAMVMGISSVSAQAAEDNIDIVSNVKVKAMIRPRYEMVDQDNALGNANAFTNRLAVGVGADLFNLEWLSGFAEMVDVRGINGNYNPNPTVVGENSVVADPDQTRLSQSYLDFKFGKTKIRAGRQEIALDNHRFIGTVPWRQMFQTFDAYSITNNSIAGLNLFGSYVTQRHTVTTTSSDKRDLFLNASYKIMPELKVTAYSYMLGSLHDTYGLSLTGDVAVNDGLKVSYRAEYATQTDATMEDSTNTSADADATYYNLTLGMNMGGILAGLGYESLSGANSSGSETSFTTPYATLHGVNGWADIFLGGSGVGAGNNDGLEDMSVYLGYTSKEFGLAKIVYHDFSSEVGSTSFGTEIDAIYKRAIPGVKNLSGMLKFAKYDADDYGLDTTKVWAMLTYQFATK